MLCTEWQKTTKRITQFITDYPQCTYKGLKLKAPARKNVTRKDKVDDVVERQSDEDAVQGDDEDPSDPNSFIAQEIAQEQANPAGSGGQKEEQGEEEEEEQVEEEEEEEEEDDQQMDDEETAGKSSSSMIVIPKKLTYGQKPGQSSAKGSPSPRPTLGGKSPRNPQYEKDRKMRGEQFLLSVLLCYFLFLTRFVNVAQLHKPKKRRAPKRRKGRLENSAHPRKPHQERSCSRLHHG